jgi:hypothetical protein
MRKYPIPTLLAMLLVIVAISIIVVFIMTIAVKFAPGWVVNVIFIWLMFLAGYAVGRFRN